MWVYAGGGYAEAGNRALGISSMASFFGMHLPSCRFIRQTPALIKPKPKKQPDEAPENANQEPKRYEGLTGKSLALEIRRRIRDYWDGTADVILVIDDADDASNDAQKLQERDQSLRVAVTESLIARKIDPTSLKIVVALAVPELEAWPIADWENTFPQILKNCHMAVMHELSTTHQLDLKHPESFQVIDENGVYRHKLSEILREVVMLRCRGLSYSKARDTPRLLSLANPKVISRKCPHFKRFWTEISKLCAPSKGARG